MARRLHFSGNGSVRLSPMLDTYFKRYFWTFHLLVLALSAVLLARTTNAFIYRALAPEAKSLAQAKSTAPSRPLGKRDATSGLLTAFLERNLFKALREDVKPVAISDSTESTTPEDYDPDECEPSSLSATLLATVVSETETESVAVFQDGTKETIARRIGEALVNDAEVVGIEWRTVRVNRGGRCEVFSLENEPGARKSTPPAPVADKGKGKASFGKGVKKVSDSEYTIPRDEIDNVLSNLNQVATQARIVPSFKNGQANGFKLFSIRPGSLYSKIGIKNGDVVQRINGFEMNSPEKALEIYTKLKDAASINVDLVRRGKSKSLTYTIQ